MKLEIRKLCAENESELEQAVAVWNEVVDDGNAFPQIETLDCTSGREFFLSQTHTGVALNPSGEVLGLYILHPNNIGRCDHICNASYAVRKDMRGNHIGEQLVLDCIKTAREAGFRVLQFNAVVKSNTPALSLYEKLGFVRLGVIPQGFLNKSGEYEDIIPHYIML